MPTSTSPWLRVSAELKKDFAFFTVVGALCGIVQLVAYNYFDKAAFGSELLQEHIAFNSLMLMTMFVLLGRGLLLLRAARGTQKESPLVEHVAARSVAFASVAASVLLGFAISAGMTNAFGHAIKFLQAALYFVSIAEVVATPLGRTGHSKLYWIALGMVVVTPILY